MRSFLLLLCFAALSCREIEPYYDPEYVRGYQVNGILTTANGIPVDSAGVQLYYYYRYYGDQPVDTTEAIVTDSSQMIDVSVYTKEYVFLKTLYSGRAGFTGRIPYIDWDGNDSQGVSMPSGKYLIRYVIDSVFIKYSTTVLHGQVSVLTDGWGNFSIPNECLPVGEIFDIYYLNGQYYVTYQVEPRIALVFIRGDKRTDYFTVELQKDKITTGAFTL